MSNFIDNTNCCVRIPTAYWAVDPDISVDALNPSFENFINGYTPPAIGSFAITNADNIEGWETNEAQNRIEVWTDTFQGVPAYDGDYFIEMNVSSPARLYQRVVVPNGKGLGTWQVAHRARGGVNTINNAEVIISQKVDDVWVDEVVQVMSSPGGVWTIYSGTFTKQCGVTELEIAFNSLDPGGFGNFLDDVRLGYTAYKETCDEGYHDGCGNLYDVDGVLLDPDSYTLCNPNCYASESYVDNAIAPETITTLATPTVDNTDPLNPVVTLAYTNEDGSQLPVNFTLNIPTPVSVVNSINLKPTANPNELTVEIVYTDDNGTTQTITDTTPIELPTPFQIGICNQECVYAGETGVTITPEIYNAENTPIVWTIEPQAVDSNATNVVIDSATGVITYDVIDPLLSSDPIDFVVTATDSKGVKVTEKVCAKVDCVCAVEGEYALLYDQDFSDQPATLLMFANGSPGTITGTDYTIDYTIPNNTVSQLTINQQNSNAGFSAGVAGLNNARPTITTNPIATGYGSIVLRSSHANTNGADEDLYTQRLLLEEDSDELFAEIFIASNKADATGNESLIFAYSIDGGTNFVSLGNILPIWAAEAGLIGTAGFDVEIPEGSSVRFQIATKEEELKPICEIVRSNADRIKSLESASSETVTTLTTPTVDNQTLTKELDVNGNLVGITIANGNTIPINTTITKEFADKSYYAVGYLSPTDIHDNGAVVNFASAELDLGWTRTGNNFSYTGTPKGVRLSTNIIANDEGVSNNWAKVRLRITETVSGRVWNAGDLAMQDTGDYDGTALPNAPLEHVNPPTNPNYLLEWFDEDARTATLIPTADSMITLVANDPIEVLTDVTIS